MDQSLLSSCLHGEIYICQQILQQKNVGKKVFPSRMTAGHLIVGCLRPLSSSQLLAVLDLQGWQTYWVQHLEAPLPGRKSKNDNDICAKHREMQFEDLQNCQRKKGWWLSLLMGFIPKYQHTCYICFSLSEDRVHTQQEKEKSNSPSLEDQQKLPTILLTANSNPSARYKISWENLFWAPSSSYTSSSKCIQNLSPMQ